MLIVSACLVGIKCRYNATSCPNKDIIKLVKEGKAIPVCPEQMGGLSTPRNQCEIKESRVRSISGEDLTDSFYKGAQEALSFAKSISCNKAILKSNSPTCGKGEIYDGTFSGRKINGNGVFTSLLQENNIEVMNEYEYKESI